MIIFFYNDEKLEKYEYDKEWEKSVLYLIKLTKLFPKRKDIILRLMGQCWYTLAFWECLKINNGLNRCFFEETFETAYKIIQSYWGDDSDCLLILGYFMCVNQMVFEFLPDDIISIELKGRTLIERAYLDNPQNEIAKLFYLQDSSLKYKIYKIKLQKKIYNYFPSDSAIDRYFVEICT